MSIKKRIFYAGSGDFTETMRVQRQHPLNASFKNAGFKIAVTNQATTWTNSTGKQSPDLYQFKLNRSSYLELNLSDITSNANVDLLDRRGNVVATSHKSGTRTESIHQLLPRGTYYVQVSTQGKPTRYQLQLSQTANTVSRASSILPDLTQRAVRSIVKWTNAVRKDAGLAPLKLSPELTIAARRHSEDLAQRDYFSHTGLNGSSAGDRAVAAGYSSTFVGENLAAGQPSARAAFRAWMNSPGHRDNILNPTYREIGVGFAFLANDTGSVNYRYYWAQSFGSPGRGQ